MNHSLRERPSGCWPRQGVRHLGLPLAFLAATLAGQSPPPWFAELGKQHLPANTSATRAVALGDLDGDGHLDLVLADDGSNRAWRNDGDGVFTDYSHHWLPPLAAATTSLALGDVDGDGDLDLVCGNAGPWGQSNLLLLNDGTGRLLDATAASLPPDHDVTTAIALGDVDGDGDLDLVCGNTSWLAAQNRLYLNDGSGRFRDVTANQLPVHADPTQAVVLADFDGDGDLDIVFGNRSSDRLLRNDGRGTFTEAPRGYLPIGVSSSLAAADVDGDGDIDLICTGAPQTWAAGGTRQLHNDGAGRFAVVSANLLPPSLAAPSALALVDIDGDGDVDLVVGRKDGANSLYHNLGGGVFVEAVAAFGRGGPSRTLAVACGDVDGNGAQDVVFGRADRDELWLGDGTGTLLDASRSGPRTRGELTNALALADIDGDGDLDLFCGNGTFIQHQNALFRNDGSGGFTDVTSNQMAGGWLSATCAAFGDVDGDGDLDLVVGNALIVTLNPASWHNSLLRNDGRGTFRDVSATHMPHVGRQTYALALADFDGDGDLDLVAGNSGQSSLHINNGAGRFVDVTSSHLPAATMSTRALAWGDVDGDGDTDLVFGNLNSPSLLYINDGTARFTAAPLSRLPVRGSAPHAVLGDVDGDGDLDLVCGGDRCRLLVNDGTGAFVDVTHTRLPAANGAVRSLALADLDGDGDLDIVGTVAGCCSSLLYRNDGRGAFEDASDELLLTHRLDLRAMALADVDDDGDLDLVGADASASASGLDTELLVLRNLTRQLHTPHLLRVGRPFRWNLHRRPASASPSLAFLYLSTRRLRVSLPPYGTLGIWPDVPQGIAVLRAGGSTTIAWSVPNLPTFVGLHVYAQALLAAPGDVRFTNVTVDALSR